MLHTKAVSTEELVCAENKAQALEFIFTHSNSERPRTVSFEVGEELAVHGVGHP